VEFFGCRFLRKPSPFHIPFSTPGLDLYKEVRPEGFFAPTDFRARRCFFCQTSYTSLSAGYEVDLVLKSTALGERVTFLCLTTCKQGRIILPPRLPRAIATRDDSEIDFFLAGFLHSSVRPRERVSLFHSSCTRFLFEMMPWYSA